MRKFLRSTMVALAAAAAILVVSACGSSSSSSSGSSSAGSASSSGAASSSSVNPTSGPGLTAPTAPSGAKVAGGTAYFTGAPSAPPSYIFPLYNFAECLTTNTNQFIDIMYRPLYWYGNNYQPTVDYNYSIGQPPQYSNGDKTVTIKLNSWKWSNGESVTSRDLVFWLNVVKASPSTEWCGFAPGYFPDLITSYSAPDPHTFVMHFNKAYNPVWVLYNVLSQLTPMPLAWDRTSLSQPAPKSDTGHLPDTTKAGAAAIYKFLDGEGKKPGSWATSPLWQVVDGPFKLESFSSDGQATLVPNPSYSGSVKATISKFVELPFTSEAAIYNQEKSGGPSAITVGNVPSQYAPQLSSLGSAGYQVNKAASYSFNFFPLNFNNPQVGPIFRQTYFREAFQHLIDQNGWINAFLYHTANPTYGPIPFAPASTLVNTAAISKNPYSFSVSTAASLLSSNGWKVVPGGQSTCQKPGTASGECGAGITKGEAISFTVDYQSSVVAIQNEMNDLAAQAKKVGITLNLTTHPFATVVGAAVPCKPSEPTCKWEAANWGAGWIYGPGYLPTGEPLYNPGAAANSGSYSNAKMTQLIAATITGPASQESAALTAYANYVSQQVPVVFGPTSVGTYGGNAAQVIDSKLGGYAANALGFINPEDWYFTK